MKTLKTIASILLMAVTFLTTSCTPDKVENPLAYTLWEHEETICVVYDNGEIHDQHQRHYLRFEEDYTGVQFIKFEAPDGSYNTSAEYFTYTFEDNKGIITFKKQGIIFDQKYTLNPDNETLHYNYSDFHKVKE